MISKSGRHYRMLQERLFCYDITVLEGTATIAHLSFGNWTRAGKISSDGINYEVVRQGWTNNRLRFNYDSVTLCETRIAGIWNRRAELELDGEQYSVVWPALDP